MKITEEMVDYVSLLARLKLPQEEKERMTGELEQILAALRRLHASMFKELEALPQAYLAAAEARENGWRRDNPAKPAFRPERGRAGHS